MPPLPTLLIADDEADIRDTLKKLFTAEPYRLVFAENGEEALALAVEAFPDAILLDVRMPGLDGLEVCRRLRADQRLGGVPIVLITGLDDKATRLAGLEAGADDFIPKPFDRVEVLTRVRAILRFNHYRQLYEEHIQLEADRQQALQLLQVHQIELQTQNEKLRGMQLELEAARARYFDLYDLAPAGYVTFDNRGIVLEANLTAADLLGLTKSAIINQPVTHLIFSEDQDLFYKLYRKLFGTTMPQTGELRLLRSSATPLRVQLAMTLTQSAGNAPVCRAVITDITEREQAEAALRESNQRFHALLRQAPLPSAIYRLVYDAQGSVVDWEISDINALGAANMGLTVETAIGKRMAALFGEEMMAPHLEISRQVATTGQPVQFESHFAGNGHDYLVSNYLIDAQHFANINIDITEHKAAENALRENEERFRTVADFTYDWEYWMGPDGNLIYCSPSCERITGYRAEAFQKQPHLLEAIVHPDDREQFANHLRTPATGTPTGFDFRILTSRGEECWISHFCQPVYGTDGRYRGRRASNRDITERKQAEAALQKSEEKYHSLFAASLDAILLTAPDGQILTANPTACRVFGYTEAEFRRLGRGAVVDASDPRLAPALEERQRTGQFMGELTFTRKGGSKFPGEISSALFQDQAGQIKTSVVIRDITERKIAERTLRQSEEQYRTLFRTVAQKSEELRALSLRLAESEEAERRQLARELHDQVGQNLTALGISLTLVQMQLAGDASNPLCARLAEAATLVERISETIRGVMAELRPPVLDDYGLEAALHWYTDEFTRRFGLPVVLHSQELKPRLSLPVETAIFRIVQEALNNVGKHAEATSVTITLVDEPDKVSVSVADNGVGFALGALRQVGKPPSWGLLTMRERAEAIGGHLQVVSEPGKGTCITVEVKR